MEKGKLDKDEESRKKTFHNVIGDSISCENDLTEFPFYDHKRCDPFEPSYLVGFFPINLFLRFSVYRNFRSVCDRIVSQRYGSILEQIRSGSHLDSDTDRRIGFFDTDDAGNYYDGKEN